MRSSSYAIRSASLLLLLLVVGAQLHLCADFTPGNSGTHVCQLCATAGQAIVAQVLLADFSPIASRLEATSDQMNFSSLSFRFTSPRAPPSL